MQSLISSLRFACRVTLIASVGLLSACATTPAISPGSEENAVVHHVSAEDIAATKSKVPLVGDSALLYIQGLGCPQCVTNIEPQLKRIKAVETIKIDLGTGTAALTFKPGVARPSPMRLHDAVADGGLTLVKVVAH